MVAQYMLSVWHDDEYELDFSSVDAQRLIAQVASFNRDLESEGALVLAGGLLPASTASVFRPNQDVTEGPYAASPAHIGGFWIIDASKPATAAEGAQRAAAASEQPVELRGLQGE